MGVVEQSWKGTFKHQHDFHPVALTHRAPSLQAAGQTPPFQSIHYPRSNHMGQELSRHGLYLVLTTRLLHSITAGLPITVEAGERTQVRQWREWKCSVRAGPHINKICLVCGSSFPLSQILLQSHTRHPGELAWDVNLSRKHGEFDNTSQLQSAQSSRHR